METDRRWTRIRREWVIKNFMAAMDFFNRVAEGEFNNRMTQVLVKYVAVGSQTADKA